MDEVVVVGMKSSRQEPGCKCGHVESSPAARSATWSPTPSRPCDVTRVSFRSTGPVSFLPTTAKPQQLLTFLSCSSPRNDDVYGDYCLSGLACSREFPAVILCLQVVGSEDGRVVKNRFSSEHRQEITRSSDGFPTASLYNHVL